MNPVQSSSARGAYQLTEVRAGAAEKRLLEEVDRGRQEAKRAAAALEEARQRQRAASAAEQERLAKLPWRPQLLPTDPGDFSVIDVNLERSLYVGSKAIFQDCGQPTPRGN